MLAGHVRPEPPTLDEALERELDFGKFHGHTLGEVAAFEPSYVDWLAGTVTRDPGADAWRRASSAPSSTGGGSGAPIGPRGRGGSRTRSASRATPGHGNAPGNIAGGADEAR